MAMLNKVLLIGRLTRDPELRYTPSGVPIAEFGFAVNRRRKGQDGNWTEEVAFVDITCFARTAELAHQYLQKGRQVFIEGHLHFDQWTNQEGQKRSKLKVVVDNLQFLDSKGEGQPAAVGVAAGAAAGAAAGGYGAQQTSGYGDQQSDGGFGQQQAGGDGFPEQPAQNEPPPEQPSGGNFGGEPSGFKDPEPPPSGPQPPPADEVPF